METASAGVLWQGFDPVAPVPVPMTVLRADPEVGAVFRPADAELLQAANPDAVIVAVPGSDHNVHGPLTIDGFHAEFDRFLDALAR